jgi:6-phosphogluconolactonase
MVHQRIVAADAAAMARLAAEWLADEVRLSATLRGSCALGLAGGATPRPVYEALAGPALAGTIAWDRVRIYFGDERAVPPDHPESNFRMAHEALIARASIPAANVHRMEAEASDLEEAADRYAALLPPALDVLVLGVGPDGHTASLFPGSPALGERTRRVVPARAPRPPERRLTITPPVIAAARRIVVLAAGRDKAEAVARALRGTGSPDEVPARLARDGVWVLDRAAAGRLADSAPPD